MFVARFVEVWLSRERERAGREAVRHERREARYASRYLSLLREAVDLLNACASHTTFEDAVVLLCVYIERFVVNRGLRLGCMGRGRCVLGKW
jgi:hypothetical protein